MYYIKTNETYAINPHTATQYELVLLICTLGSLDAVYDNVTIDKRMRSLLLLTRMILLAVVAIKEK